MMQNINLQTARLQLNEMALTDAPDLFKIWSNREVARYMNIEPFQNIEQAEMMIQMISDLPTAIRYTIRLKDTGEIIGSAGFNDIDETYKVAEIGYDINQDYWGLGYGTEAINALIAEAKERGITKLKAKVVEKNAASLHLLRKVAFIFDAVVVEEGEELYVFYKPLE